MKIQKILRIIKYLLKIPIWWLSYITPINKNLWIFGAWFGDKYADNSKYLFEYVNDNCPEIKAIWLSKDVETIQLIKSKGYKAYKIYSFMGYFYSLIAKYGFVSTGFFDINCIPTANMRIINLWHGIPLKKIMNDDDITAIHPPNDLYNRLRKVLFPFLYDNYYSTIATSEEINKIYQSAFKGLTKHVNTIGQTRCDSFYSTDIDTIFKKKLKQIKNAGNKLAIYMPTHRKEGKVNFSEFLISELEKLNDFLVKNNIVMLIKLHYYHLADISNLNVEYSNIIFIKDTDIEQDIYSVLPFTDILITDYSSIYFDYLHIDKPIIFFAFDKEDYLQSDREMYFDYEDVTPGEKAYNWTEFYQKLSLISGDIDNYKSERKQMHERFNKYQDGKNCERVVEWIRSLDK